MPILPQYNSNRNIQPTTGEPLRNETAQSFEAQNNLLATATGIAQKWSDANDVMQYTKAKANYEVATTEIQSKAAADPDYNNSPKYFKELEDAKKNNLGLIANKEIANKAALEFDLDKRITEGKINQDFRKKQLKDNEFNIDRALDSLVQTQTTSGNQKEINYVNMKIRKVLSANVLAENIDKETAHKKYQEAIQKRASYDMFNSPSYVVSELNKKDGGIYKDIPFEERNKLLATASDLKERKDIEIRLLKEQAINKTETEVVDLYAAGKLDFTKLPELEKSGTITPEFSKTMQKTVTSPKAFRAETDLMTYEDLFQSVLSKDLKPEVLRRKILQANVDGKLSMTDARRLLYVQKDEMGISTVYGDYIEEQQKLKEMNGKKDKKQSSLSKGFWNVVKDIAISNPLSMNVLTSTIDRASKEQASGEKIIDIANDEARKQRVIADPTISKISQKGELRKDKYGTKFIQYPDGSYELVQDKEGNFTHKESRKKE